ncbi:ABC transporter substrate-binding protein [Rathayibacter sp. SD072]|uniref:ABC transporter substrate-binding protein n=1 Tax=Rathayibacter sp. SD072 TaxID=2781731 RepID=UPI001A95CDAB|nr:ABC transporter substrate-binding protein [Rathayibacter sp. SD072]MBO0982652.1 ABC transporter substrate-binding protein [Rathayibacter sp. SD072]
MPTLIRVATVATAAAAALLLSSCSATPEAASTPGSYSTDTIRGTFGSDPTSFDAAKANAQDDYVVARLLFDSVLRRDDDGALVGGLASEWDATPTEATLTIRDGATCADGTEITPTVVADSLTYFADPETKNNFAKLVFGPGTPTITADDAAGTVSIALAQPWSETLRGLTLPQSGIICPAGLADKEGLAAGTVEGAFSGPYTVASATHGVSYEMSLREDYDAWPTFAKEVPGVPAAKLVFAAGVAPATAANQLSTGELDVATVAPADSERFSDEAAFGTATVPANGTWLLFNEREGHPFTDPALRKAVAQAIDPQAFDAAAYGGKGFEMFSIVAPNIPFALTDDEYLTKKNLDEAREVLEGKTFKMVGTTAIGVNGAGNTYVQEALRAVGATVELQNVDNGAWATMTQQQPDTWDITVQGDANFVGTVAASATRVSGTPTELGGRNIGGGENPEIVAAIAEAQAATDDEAKGAAYQKVQELILQDNVIVPLTGGTQFVIQRAGFSISTPSDILDWSTLRITK